MLKLIEKYNLVIRKLPDIQISKSFIDEKRISDYKLRKNERIECYKPTIEKFETEEAFNSFYKKFPNGRFFVVEEKRKDISNKFLVTYSNNFLSNVTFNLKSKDVFIADTMEEAIKKCVNYIEESKNIKYK